jgi:hypothetical protein
MRLRLLIDMDVFDILSKYPASRRRRLIAHFRKIQNFPENYSEFVEPDDEGKQLDMSTFEDISIHYWIDYADRHVKILRLSENE